MKSIKKILRLALLALMILLAISGISITGTGLLLTRKNEQDYDNEIKTELAEGHQETLEEKAVE